MSAQAERRLADRQCERARLRRDQPISVGSALLLALLALLAVSLDVALYAFIVDHYQRHGHISLPINLAAAALGFTALAIFACISIAKGVSNRTGSM